MNVDILKDTDVSTLANICFAAAAQYTTDAHTQDQANNPALAEQFRKQAATAREWGERFDSLPTVTVEHAAASFLAEG